VTGSMYNGNNDHPPKLPGLAEETAAAQSNAQPTRQSENGDAATGQHLHGGRGASQGGAN